MSEREMADLGHRLFMLAFDAGAATTWKPSSGTPRKLR